MHLSSLKVIQFGSWSIKASSFDDQIFVAFYNKKINYTFSKIFYCEEKAYSFISCFLEGYYHEKNYKVS